MRPLLVGQAPGRRRGGGPAFCGSTGSGSRLRRLLGVDARGRFDVVNLLRRFPGKSGKGDRFPLAAARRAAGKTKLEGRPAVLLVGRGVASAFRVRLPYFE